MAHCDPCAAWETASLRSLPEPLTFCPRCGEPRAAPIEHAATVRECHTCGFIHYVTTPGGNAF